jgi:acyl transferase domain-containing protein/NAD(P)-dependent dehydrogenase (short-subunit alcohol dehydrogenase family)
MTETDDRQFKEEALRSLRKLRARIEELEKAASAPIAIIGSSCRFPGAEGTDAYWNLLRDGVDAIREVPAERWDVSRWYAPPPAVPGKSYGRWGGFIEHLDKFDARMFAMKRVEAEQMDPQQRVLLEVVWEALESAAIDPHSLRRSSTGTFIGISSSDYQDTLMRVTETAENFDFYSVLGAWKTMTVGRVNYFLDLWGPAEPFDTACSSSLVAIHRACRALRAGEVNLALSGGVNAVLSPEVAVMACQGNMFARDGRCKFFDSRADGFVRSDGCGVLVLKRLADAQRDGNQILAVIRGVAVNHDGRSQGITAPNGLSQQQVIRTALADAGLSPDDVDYVECHGTGTSLGDPQECEALGEVFQTRSKATRVQIGSVKSNMGHLEAAAGVAGLLKIVMALRHAELPPSIHLRQSNPQIPLDEICLQVPTMRHPWPKKDGRPRRAGVSSFGISGTNAHVVLEEPPDVPTPSNLAPDGPTLFALSASTDEGLRSIARRHAAYLHARTSVPIDALARTMVDRQEHGDHRAAFVVEGREEVQRELLAISRKDASPKTTFGESRPSSKPLVAFVFTGMGAQYPTMGRALYDRFAVFRDVIDECDAAASPILRQSLREVMYDKDNDGLLMRSVAYTQPALFATALATAHLWRALGVECGAVIGHSVGEFAAACFAGSSSISDMMALVVERGRLLATLPPDGLMAVVFTDADVVEARAKSAGISIAARNAPGNVVVSGAVSSVESLLADFERGGVRVRRLETSRVAFHSDHMDPILDAFEASARAVRGTILRIPMQSTMTGERLSGFNVPSAEYWRRHCREPVHFADSVKKLADSGLNTFLEVGPGAGLANLVGLVVNDVRSVGTFKKGSEFVSFLQTASELWASGVNIDVVRALGDNSSKVPKVALPRFPFQRERFSLTPRGKRPEERATARGGSLTTRPLLKTRLSSPLDVSQFEGRIGPQDPPWLVDHKVLGTVIWPGAGHLELALESLAEMNSSGFISLNDIEFEIALVFPDGSPRPVQVVVEPRWPNQASFTIHSSGHGDDQWITHARGKAEFGCHRGPLDAPPLAQLRRQILSPVAIPELYERGSAGGMEYGPSFRLCRELYLNADANEAVSRVELPPNIDSTNGYVFHPAVVDACLHALMPCMPGYGERDRGSYWPLSIDKVNVYAPVGSVVWVHTKFIEKEDGRAIVNIRLYSEDERCAAELIGLRIERVTATTLAQREKVDTRDWLWEVAWKKRERDSAPVVAGPPRRWIVVDDERGFADAVEEALRARGDEVERVPVAGPSELRERLRSFLKVRPADVVLVLRALDTPNFVSWTDRELGRALELGPQTCFEIAQELVAGTGTVPQLVFVTRNAARIRENEDVEPQHGILVGLTRTLAREHPSLRPTLVDLDGASTQNDVRSLVAAVTEVAGETELYVRPEGLFVPRVEPSPLRVRRLSATRIDNESGFLITGGLGALGLEVARWLVSHGARKLVLFSRRAVGSRERAILNELEKAGAEVVVVTGDATNREDVQRAVGAVGPALRGVFHLAGTLEDKVFARQTWGDFSRVLAPKLVGGWLLHELTREHDLSMFVMFSSITAIIGNAGQANHAAACAFEDALAHHRAHRVLPSISVNFGPWSEVGVAAHLDLLRRAGTNGMSTQSALAALRSVLEGGRTQVGVFPGDFWYPKDDESCPTLLESVRRRSPGETAAAPPVGSEAANDVRLEDMLTEIWTTAFGLREPIALDEEFFDLGGDSLIAMRITAAAGKRGVKFTVNDLFNSPTIRALGELLAERTRGESEDA